MQEEAPAPMRTALLFALFAAFVRKVYTVYKDLGIDTVTAELRNDGTCRLVAPEGMVGSEDMALGKHGLLFVTSGDLHHIWDHGTEGARPGGIWWARLGAGDVKPRRLDLVGFDLAAGFNPHGLHVSNVTDRLYVVNHAPTYSAIEVFIIDYGPGDDGPLPKRALHLRTVRSELFLPRGLNDVAEGSKNHFFVTTWKAFQEPMAGKLHAAGLWEHAAVLGNALNNIAALPLTRLLRCDIGPAGGVNGACYDAVPFTGILGKLAPGAFVAANGITASADRSQLFVNDPPAKTVYVFDHHPYTGRLTLSSSFHTVFCVDQVEWDSASGELLMGAITRPIEYVVNDMSPDAQGLVAGTMLVGKHTDAGWIVEHVLTHDGSKLSQVSSAARFGGTVVLGSPFSRGMLVCEL